MNSWDLTQKTTTEDGNDVSLTYGNITMVSDLEALRARIDANLQIVKGELQDSTLGVDYFGIILTNAPLSMKVQELCRVINSIDGVSKTNFNYATQDKKTGALTFNFTIKSVYGDVNYERTFDNSI